MELKQLQAKTRNCIHKLKCEIKQSKCKLLQEDMNLVCFGDLNEVF